MDWDFPTGNVRNQNIVPIPWKPKRSNIFRELILARPTKPNVSLFKSLSWRAIAAVTKVPIPWLWNSLRTWRAPRAPAWRTKLQPRRVSEPFGCCLYAPIVGFHLISLRRKNNDPECRLGHRLSARGASESLNGFRIMLDGLRVDELF